MVNPQGLDFCNIAYKKAAKVQSVYLSLTSLLINPYSAKVTPTESISCRHVLEMVGGSYA